MSIEKSFKASRKIEDSYDYNAEAIDIFEAFLRSFTIENGGLRYPNEDDSVDPDECEFLYSDRAMRLIDRMESRLYKLGDKYWPDEIEIQTHLYQEF